jgi:hypothetical protein
MKDILLVIFLSIGIYIEILYLIEKKKLLKNIDYKLKYDFIKKYSSALKDDTVDLKKALEQANEKVEIANKRALTNQKIVEAFRKIPTATKRKLGLLEKKEK